MIAARVMRPGVDVRYECRGCGSGEFGSSQLPDGHMQRYCHGQGCRVKFSSTADYRHFRVDGKYLPSRAAFERTVYMRKPAPAEAPRG